MKNKLATIKHLAIVIACIVGACVLLCLGTFHLIGQNATANNGYLNVYQADLTCTKWVDHENVYRIYVTYGNAENTLPHTGYGDYNETNVSLQTDDADALNLNVLEGNGTNKLSLAISMTDANGCVGYDAAAPSMIVIPKGTTFTPVKESTNGYSGICFAENIIFEKSADGWKTADCATVAYTDGDAMYNENVALNGSFSLPNAAGSGGRQFVGWELAEKLYPAGERIKTTDITTEKNAVITAKAAYMDFSLSAQPSIRFGNALSNSGISFSAMLSKASYAEYGEYLQGLGVIVMPSDLLQEDTPFTLENYDGAGQAKNFLAEPANIDFSIDDTIFTYRATIVNLLPANYRRDFSARAYLLIEYANGVQYVWNDVIASGDPYGLANNVLQSGRILTDFEKTVLNTYAELTA